MAYLRKSDGSQQFNGSTGRGVSAPKPAPITPTEAQPANPSAKPSFPAQPANPGFTVATVWGPVTLTTNNLLDDSVRQAYTSGQCQALAYILSKRTGWPIVVALDAEAPADLDRFRGRHLPGVIAQHLDHAMVRRPDGLLVDIGGARHVKDYLESRPGMGFEPGDYQGRDTDWLEEDDFHPEDCVCTDQCYPEGMLTFVGVDAELFWEAYGWSDWPEQDLHAASHYADLLLRAVD